MLTGCRFHTVLYVCVVGLRIPQQNDVKSQETRYLYNFEFGGSNNLDALVRNNKSSLACTQLHT